MMASMTTAGRVLTVNVGQARRIPSKAGVSGIDKRPVVGSVSVRAPGPKGTAGGGLDGDAVCDLDNHGGNDQAVYAYAAEDLQMWGQHLGREIAPGTFGENLTTLHVDITRARVGERWRVGDDVVLGVTSPRVPCRTFAVWLDEQGWVKTFTHEAHPGAYLCVLEPGEVRAGDTIEILLEPQHRVTMELMFRAFTRERHLLPSLLEADAYLTDDTREFIRRYSQARNSRPRESGGAG
jgi:MOSC domain-containing protein YiiM